MENHVNMIFPEECHHMSLKDIYGDEWTFGGRWMPGNTNTPVAYVCKNGVPCKTTDGKGNHRGHIMFKDADGVVNIVHGHQSRYKSASSTEGRVNRMCRSHDVQHEDKWDKGWNCVWTNVPVDVLTAIHLRYGRHLHR